MANVFEFDDEKLAAWNEWLNTRPDSIKELATKYPPNKLYLLTTTNQRVTIHSYCEDGTVTVLVTGDYNRVAFPTNVFGIKPKDLMECDLPGADEDVGDTSAELEMTEDEVEEMFIKPRREIIMKKRQAEQN